MESGIFAIRYIQRMSCAHKSCALFHSLHMFIGKQIGLEEVVFLFLACLKLLLFKRDFNLKETTSQNKMQFYKNFYSSDLGNLPHVFSCVMTS